MIIQVPNEQEQQRILVLTEAKGRRFRCRLPMSPFRGIIHSIPLVNAEDEIHSKWLGYHRYSKCWPVKRQVHGGCSKMINQLLVTFKYAVPPEVELCSMTFPVELYFPLRDGWIRCKKCGRNHP
jgi:hypothetical protein